MAIEARQTIAMLGMIYLILVSLLPHSIPLPASGERKEISRTPGVGAGLKPAPTRPDFAACGMKWWREGFESRPQHEP
jgi:hypothetical protein